MRKNIQYGKIGELEKININGQNDNKIRHKLNKLWITGTEGHNFHEIRRKWDKIRC